MALSATAILNGERAVVLLFISRVIYSLPPAFLYHGVSLSLLSLFALYVEIVAEKSSSSFQFKTRPGASSGILLGAVTLPAVFTSKLIQLSRALETQKVGIEELSILKMQYWAASASCFGVLIILRLAIQRRPDKSPSPCSRILNGTKYWWCCVVLYAVLCCFSVVDMSHNGVQLAVNLLWVICHGFAAVNLIQHVLGTFPSCASIGEALLVSSGLVLYTGDMLACTFSKVKVKLGFSEMVSFDYLAKRSEISIILQGVLLGVVLFPLIFKGLLQIWEYSLAAVFSNAKEKREYGRSALFFLSLVFFLAIVVPSWMQFVGEFDSHPLLWVFSFIFGEPMKRLSICIYWLGLIFVSVKRFYNISKNSKTERILLRKYYHLMAVSMFSPALIFQPEFLALAFGVALAVFLVLEIIRVWRIGSLGQIIHNFMNAFTDHRDSDLLIVSHFSLLLGCALPMWMSSGYNDRPLAPFAGILSLGIGDTMASVVGHKYGVLRWSKTGKKTVEGTAAGITSVLAACSVLLPLLASTGYLLTQHWFSLFLSVTVSGLLEAYTAQLDNAFIPLVFYSLLCL